MSHKIKTQNFFIRFTLFILILSSFAFAEQGLTGKYYKDKYFTNLVCDRVDPNIDFNWYREAPYQCPGTGYNDFSIMWEGYLEVRESGMYQFKINHDDDAQMFVDGVEVFKRNGWSNGNFNYGNEVYLSEGYHKIKVKFVEGWYDARIHLGWLKNGQDLGIISPEYFSTEDKGIKLVTEVTSAYEGDMAHVSLNLEGKLFQNGLRVEYYTQDDTAKNGVNYEHISGSFTFTQNEKQKIINIQTIDDNVQTEDKKFKFYFKIPPQNGYIGSNKDTYSEVIVKNKAPLSIGFSKVSYEGKEGENIRFDIVLNRPSDKEFSVKYTTKEGSAKISDFVPQSGILTFSKNDVVKHVDVALKNDQIDEGDESFWLELSNGANTPNIIQPTAQGVIKGKQKDINDQNVLDTNQITSPGSDGDTYTRSVNLRRDFKLRYGGKGYAIYGDMSATGESVLCPAGNDAQGCNWDSTNAVEYESTHLLNEDSANFNKNSSKADLILPKEVKNGNHIAYARLYWQGFVSEDSVRSIDQLKDKIKGWSSIKFKTPTGLYDLQADLEDTNWFGYWGKPRHNDHHGGRFGYQASVDVTDIVKDYFNSSVFQNTQNKTFMAGNIVATTEGNDPTMIFHTLRDNYRYTGNVYWGHWAGWSLVVVYDMNEPLPNVKYKNIAIYDGFTYLIPWYDRGVDGIEKYDSISIDVDGFYTPSSGKVDASMTLFTGSGNGVNHDSYGAFSLYNPLTKQWYRVSNSLNPDGQPLNGSFSFKNKPLVQGRKNHAAMDLDTFDVSEYMSNKQTSAKLKLEGWLSSRHAGRTEAAYSSLPSMLAFTTEIYSPNVCYEEHIFYNGNEVGSLDENGNKVLPLVGSTLKTKLSIRNEGYEKAQKIRFYASFDQNFSYVDNSLEVGNTDNAGYAQSLEKNSPLASFVKPNENDDTNISIYLGRGASKNGGGDFEAMRNKGENEGEIDEARVNYELTFHDPEFKVRKYFVEYENKDLGLKYNGRIFECKETDRSFKSGTLGNFNVVNQNFNSNEISNDKNDPKNSLYTQISGKEFSVKILSLKNKSSANEKTKVLSPYTGEVKISLVTPVHYKANDTDQAKILKCQNATALTPIKKVRFSNESKKQYTLKYNDAIKEVAFRIQYTDLDGDKCITSLDSFSVRPAKYDIALAESAPYVGGKLYTLDAKALQKNASIPLYYVTNNVELNVTSDFNAGCGVHENNSSNIIFNNGKTNHVKLRTGNIGDYNLSLYDDSWTAVDQQAKSNGFYDCIKGSSAYEHNSQGKVGCDIFALKQIEFEPKAFRMTNPTISNFDSSVNFTYMAQESNITQMHAKYSFDIEAVLEYDTSVVGELYDTNKAKVATAFDKNCYAKDTDIDISFIATPPLWSDTVKSAKKSVKYSDINDVNLQRVYVSDENVKFKLKKDAFTNGLASVNVGFNFEKNITKPLQPFNITNLDFNITKVQAGSTIGSDTNKTIADSNATFFYGRVWAPDVVGRSPVKTNINFEVFCDIKNGCDNNLYGLNEANFINDKWYLNKVHNNAILGKIYNIKEQQYQNAYQTKVLTLGTFSNGYMKDVVLKNNNSGEPSYTDTMEIAPSYWLLYNFVTDTEITNNFEVTFTKRGKWVGEGEVGHTVGERGPAQVNRRAKW